MYLTGFADEAAKDIDGQIKATKALGWENIESRAIDGTNLHDISDQKFDEVEAKLKDAGVTINCFGSAIANWGKKIDEPNTTSIEETERAIPRMKRLGSPLIRIMSYAVLPDREPHDQMKEERFARLRDIVQRFTDEGLTPVHENCMNFGGMSAAHTLELVENVPGLKLVYDTGNPAFTDDRSKPKPYPKQDALEFYRAVKDHVAYIHIKDGIWRTDANAIEFCYPGEGEGKVKEIVAELFADGYDGGISIEPHMGSVFHEDEKRDATPEEKFDIYVEYGKRMEAIIAEAKSGTPA